MGRLSALIDPRDPSPSAPGSREISAAAERARERVRNEFEQLRIGIEKLRAKESGGDSPLFAISDDAERARERVREEFEELRTGIEKQRAGEGRKPKPRAKRKKS
jgi:hypothetical protein